MKQVFFVLIWLIVLSCAEESSEIGSDFFTAGALDISSLDSSTVKLSTIRLKELITNNTDGIIVGTHVDSKLGRITSAAFVQLGVPANVSLDEDDTDYAYCTITMKYNRYAYYDTTKTLTLNVHMLNEEMELASGGELYNTDVFSFDETPLASITRAPRPNRDDSLEIRLPDALGKMLYEKIVNGDNDIESNSKFVNFFPGIAILPDTTSSASLIGFSSDVQLRIYYVNRSIIPVETDFVAFSTYQKYYNTYFKSAKFTIAERERISSTKTAGESYIQSGSGLLLRVDIPYLRNLRQIENFYVSRAILEIYPVKKSYNEMMPLPEALNVYQINRRNALISENVFIANLALDTDLGRDTRYQVDITSFVKQQMDIQEFNENALMFAPADETLRSSVDRIHFASKNSEYKTGLKIYYATINR